MKKTLIFITLIVCMITSILGVGCKSNVSEVCLFNGYETYSDLDKILMHDGIQGKANIVKDKNFVTQGNASLKIELDYLSEFTSSAMYATKIHYVASRYDEKFSWIDDVKEIGVDIYNDNDEQFEFFFGVYGEQELTMLNDGQTLIPNSWNYIRIPVKQWFFEEGTLVKEYRMYINGASRLEDRKATFYIDNFNFSMNEKFETPKVEVKDNQILSFNTPSELDMILVKNGVDVYELLPHVYVKHAPNKMVGDKKGCYEVTFSRSHYWGDMYVTDDKAFGADSSGYDIILHESLVESLSGAKSVSLTCANPNPSIHDVTLIAKNGNKKYLSKIDLVGGETKTVTLQLPNEIDYFAIRIGSWNVTEQCALYLRDLVCSR